MLTVHKYSRGARWKSCGANYYVQKMTPYFVFCTKMNELKITNALAKKKKRNY